MTSDNQHDQFPEPTQSYILKTPNDELAKNPKVGYSDVIFAGIGAGSLAAGVGAAAGLFFKRQSALGWAIVILLILLSFSAYNRFGQFVADQEADVRKTQASIERAGCEEMKSCCQGRKLGYEISFPFSNVESCAVKYGMNVSGPHCFSHRQALVCK